MSIQLWGETDPGMQRDHNEDAVAWDQETGIAVLADGVGGHNAGEVASALVIDTVMEALSDTGGEPLERLAEAVREANRRVHEAAQENLLHSGMGATVVAAIFTPERLMVAHVGDSRLYRLREGNLEQLTVDHSLVQEMVDGGFMSAEEARQSANRHVITRALGSEPAVEVDVAAFDSHSGDRILLCSDGLTDMVDGDRLAGALAREQDPRSLARELVALANEAGGTDNISVIVADIG